MLYNGSFFMIRSITSAVMWIATPINIHKKNLCMNESIIKIAQNPIPCRMKTPRLNFSLSLSERWNHFGIDFMYHFIALIGFQSFVSNAYQM